MFMFKTVDSVVSKFLRVVQDLEDIIDANNKENNHAKDSINFLQARIAENNKESERAQRVAAKLRSLVEE